MMLFRSLAIVSLALLAKQASAAFGITTNTASYIIDAGSPNPLKFTVSRTNCDITSINYYGSELQYKSTASHIGSGLGSATVTATQSGELRHNMFERKCPDQYRRLHQGDLCNVYLDTLLCCAQRRFDHPHGNIHNRRFVPFVLKCSVDINYFI
jgi:rhamnogalacturonan endolyase